MQSIKEKLEKSKCIGQYLQKPRVFGGIVLILGLFAVFGAIRLTTLFNSRLGITIAEASFDTNTSDKDGSYVASKNGGSYYFPWCGIAGRIKDANKVWFTSRADAEKAGYKPSSNCHGLR